MKRTACFLLIIFLSLGLGVTAFLLCRHTKHPAAQTIRPELLWLRSEYQLNETQFSRIVALHEKYQPICDAYCAQIATKNAEIDRLIRSNTDVTPALAQAFNEESALRTECRVAMIAHVYAISREMSPGHGRRYLEMMATRITCPTPEMGHGSHTHK